MRLIVARCEVTYTGRLTAYLPESTRLLMVKADGSVLVHADAGGYKPLNWMTPPTVFEDGGDDARRPQAGRAERGSARDPAARGALRRRARDGRGGCAREGRRRTRPAARPRREPRDARAGPAPRPPRVADRRRPRRPDVPRRGRRLGRSRDQASRHDRRGRAAHPLSRLHPRRSVARRVPRHPRRPADQAAGDRRSPSRAASRASRSISLCCAASASPSSRSSQSDRQPPSAKADNAAACRYNCRLLGAIAQLGERLDRTQEVDSSNLSSSIQKRPAIRPFLLHR